MAKKDHKKCCTDSTGSEEIEPVYETSLKEKFNLYENTQSMNQMLSRKSQLSPLITEQVQDKNRRQLEESNNKLVFFEPRFY